mmetsp:Transcript_71744/g.115838  ORF Transcript_71744/g.115838 Transcript_71744/m.115838 type:complete len:482 (+) Transcript_71744:85-1530(+)
MMTSTQKARWLPKDFVEVSQTGGLLTLVTYAIMLLVFMSELSSFLSPGYSTVMSLDKHGSDALQINFDVDVHDIECRNLKIVVFAQNNEEKISTFGEDFWLRSIDSSGKTFGMAIKPMTDAETDDSDHQKQMKELLAKDGKKELDADWSDSHDGFNHQSFDHVLQAHDFTFINFFAGWCGHCQQFAPEWNKMALTVNGDERVNVPAQLFNDRDGKPRQVRMIKMNCVDFQSICREKGIDAYPMLRLYKADGTFSIYDGKRGEVEIMRWIERTIRMKSYGWGSHHEAFEKGCNAKGRLQVPRVPGHLELTVGDGDQNLNTRMINVSHSIKHLSFSDPDDGRYHRKGWANLPNDVTKHLSPLDGRNFLTQAFHQAYIHDLKVVSTVAGGKTSYQFKYTGRVSTLAEDKIPQAQFHYDIEPFSINVKRDEKRWYDFGTSLCAILGGAFVVMRLISRFTLGVVKTVDGKKGHRGASIAAGGLNYD